MWWNYVIAGQAGMGSSDGGDQEAYLIHCWGCAKYNFAKTDKEERIAWDNEVAIPLSLFQGCGVFQTSFLLYVSKNAQLAAQYPAALDSGTRVSLHWRLFRIRYLSAEIMEVVVESDS